MHIGYIFGRIQHGHLACVLGGTKALEINSSYLIPLCTSSVSRCTLQSCPVNTINPAPRNKKSLVGVTPHTVATLRTFDSSYRLTLLTSASSKSARSCIRRARTVLEVCASGGNRLEPTSATLLQSEVEALEVGASGGDRLDAGVSHRSR